MVRPRRPRQPLCQRQQHVCPGSIGAHGIRRRLVYHAEVNSHSDWIRVRHHTGRHCRIVPARRALHTCGEQHTPLQRGLASVNIPISARRCTKIGMWFDESSLGGGISGLWVVLYLIRERCQRGGGRGERGFRPDRTGRAGAAGQSDPGRTGAGLSTLRFIIESSIHAIACCVSSAATRHKISIQNPEHQRQSQGGSSDSSCCHQGGITQNSSLSFPCFYSEIKA